MDGIQGATGSQSVRLHLLAGFELRSDGWVGPPPPRGVQRLLAFLALQRHPAERSYIAGVLWSDCNTTRASANLRSVIWRTQRCERSLVSASASTVALAPGVHVDIREVDATAWRVTGRNGACTQEDVRCLAAAGELLPDWYDDWLRPERERIRQLRLHALDTACQRLTEERRYAEAIEAGLAAVAADPLRESSHSAIIRAHLAEGNHSDAVRQYRFLRQVLRRELRLEPALAVTALVAHLLDLPTPW